MPQSIRALPHRKAAIVTTTLILLVVSAHAQPAASITIDNFGQVNAAYYRGAQPKGRDYRDLAALGVRTVIDLTSDDGQRDEPALAAAEGMKYVRIPMTMHTPPTPDQVAQFLSIVNDAGSQPVFVHCVGGRHRTGVMTAVYRMVHNAWTPERAFAEMRQFKFGTGFLHPEFKKFVLSYDVKSAQAASSAPGGR
jgi:protein tyrosine/serine phosphatase